MKTIETLSTNELRALETKHQNPQTAEEACILHGAKTELDKRHRSDGLTTRR